MDRIVECVPNFSEGCDQAIIQAIAAAAASAPGVKVLDVDPGSDFNRTVYTFVGAPEDIVEGALRAARIGLLLLDMTRHKGEHARMGALDVCPFIPIKGVTMQECVALSKEFAEKLANDTGIPVFLYANSASDPKNIRLPDIRKGEYEALEEKLTNDPGYMPDFGPKEFIPKSGATATGARDILIAYNVNLATSDKSIAGKISGKIRTSGVIKRDEKGDKIIGQNGKAERIPGMFQGIQAGGMMYDENIAQVSMNLLNYKEVNMHTVYDEIVKQATELGTRVTGSEIVGLVPKDSLVLAGKHYAHTKGLTVQDEDGLVSIACEELGLSDLSPFDPHEKVIEYIVEETNRLVDKTITDFLDTTASKKPAPGGGSVAALSGALGAALTSMVCNLTRGKEKYADVEDDMRLLLMKSEDLRKDLAGLIDLDTSAFNDVITAFRMAKDTDGEKKARSRAIQEGYKKAAKVPLRTATVCEKILDLAKIASEKGNPSSISDAAVSALMAQAGVEGAVLNVKINLSSIKDESFRNELSTTLDSLCQTTRDKTCAILRSVEDAL